MPCYTIQTTEIQFGQKTDTALLTKALAALGLSPAQMPNGIQFRNGSFNSATGNLTLQGVDTESRTTQLRQAYGAEIAKREAARHGWTLNPIPGKQFAYTVTKR